MKTYFSKEIAVVGIVLWSFLFLGGCASKQDVEVAMALAEEAQGNAVDAMVCCEANSMKISRMYQKIMSK